MTLKLNQFNFSVIDAAATRVAARCVNSDVKTMCSTTAATRVAARQRAVCEFFLLPRWCERAFTVAILNCASFNSLWCLMNRKGKSLNKQCSIGIIKFLGVSKVTTRVHLLSFGIDTASQSFCRSFILPWRWYVVQSQHRNPLFRCVKSLKLLWKPHSWF